MFERRAVIAAFRLGLRPTLQAAITTQWECPAVYQF